MGLSYSSEFSLQKSWNPIGRLSENGSGVIEGPVERSRNPKKVLSKGFCVFDSDENGQMLDTDF